MVDRFLLWLGAGVVIAGMSAAMLAGAGFAAAEDGSASDGGGATSSESSKPADTKPDSEKPSSSANEPSSKPADSKPTEKPDDGTDKPKPSDDSTAEPADETAGSATEEPTAPASTPTVEETKSDPPTGSDHVAEVTTKPADPPTKPVTATPEAEVKPVATQEPADAVADPGPELAQPAEVTPAVGEMRKARTADTAATAAVAFAGPGTAEITDAAAAPSAPSLINVIGTLIFNLYSFATKLFGGPPVVPPGSTVTVRQSTLQIDCGDGYVVDADWYIPATAEPPTRLIYLQHGFLASGPWYSYTAAALAEQTNSIVVAPSLTSNFFACDACWLGAAPMQQAVADLFVGDREALTASALAAGYSEALPQRVVLVGHSLGGGLVAATAGYMVDNGTIGDLAGVVMLDGVGMNDAVPTGLAKVPDDLPIYQLGAPSYFWNQFGAASDALVEARPDRFVGVTLAGGSHVDAMQGGNPLIQFSQQLVAGFSQPQNVEAAKILMVGWINDMFAGTQDDGIYGQPGEVITIDTPAGQATAVALPSGLVMHSPLDLLQPFVTLGMGFFTFEPTCGPEVPCTEMLVA